MSFITEKYKAGEVHFEGLAIGWYFEETFEFRPLMIDAVMELYTKGYIDEDIVYATSQARDKHTEEFFATYEPKELTSEDVFEMKAAFGEFDDVVEVFTGDILHLAEY